MSAGPANPVDRLEQAATQFKNSGVSLSSYLCLGCVL